MSKPVLGAALSIKSIPAHRDWLLDKQRDLEIQDFFRADLLDGDWRSAATEIKQMLSGHTGRLGMFGISTASESGLIRPLAFAKIALSLPLFNPIGLMNDNRSVFGVNLGHMWHENGKVRSWVQILLQGVADGWVRPHVDKTFPLAEVGAAQTYIEQRRNTGKVVLVP